MTTTAEWRKWNAVQTKPITNADRIEHNRREQCREIQRALIDHYINFPRLRDELYSACTTAFEALIEKEKKTDAESH